MIDDRTMDDLRLAAALVHAVPGLRLRVGPEGDGFTVRAGPGPGELGPCGFRAAVAEAHRHRREGRAVALRHLPPGRPPLLLAGDGGAARVLPGGIVLFRCGGEERVAAATLLAPAACRDLLADEEDPVVDLLRLHHDEALEVSVLHAGGPEADLDDALRAVLGALAGCVAEELVAAV